MKSGFGGNKFPELVWIPCEKWKTLIFCQTIGLGWWVFEYLYILLRQSSTRLPSRMLFHDDLIEEINL
jgi:hypothetical protein